MNLKLLDNTAHTALTERMKSKICSISDAVGNIFKFKNNFYIVTCKHIADVFFNYNEPYIILGGNKRIYADNLKYVASTSDQLDIAIIEISNSSEIKDYFDESDLLIIEDFNNDFENSFYFICGFPYQLHYNKDEKEYIPWMSYMTIKSKEKKSNEDYIYLDYARESERNIIYERQLKTMLPRASGLSGTFIFKVDKFDKNEIWQPSFAKAIAIQSTWNTKTWLKGTNIKHLTKLLNETV